MKIKKIVLLHVPEIYLILLTITYWCRSSWFNPIAIVLLIALLVQIRLDHKALGISIGIVFTLLSLYMSLALYSEVQDFPTFSGRAQLLLYAGSTVLCLNLIMSTIMIAKLINNQARQKLCIAS